MKSILITGGTGFIGQQLCPDLLSKGYELTVLSRQSNADVRSICGRVTPIHSTDEVPGLDTIDAVINLAGEGIAASRWTKSRKEKLMDSRVALTRSLVDALKLRTQKPEVFISGSAVGYYGSQDSATITENAAPNQQDFTHRLCSEWEKAALPAEEFGARVCFSRTGIVVGKNGGFLSRMTPPFRMGLGGRLGDGSQYMPWVHRDDVVRALCWMLETPTASGPYNVVSPRAVTNDDFTRALGRTLGRPTLIPVPAFVLKLGLGEMATLLLEGQNAKPARLQAEGFDFRYSDLDNALKASL
ncbi:MAG: TIGR01777 family protein [Alteromonadaceae bacterium]|nr:TIGR01777 family protein [Alteromonadaceae bacterium]MBH85683.1 TIGR01777 family protein [Alteromonadaceae bacterium]|tara:strand:+ start:66497 stop:67396 length:900 start_codon:yes stop_codon:yes gene_type:complete